MQKDRDEGIIRSMSWELILQGAKQLGDEYKEYLGNIGRDAVMKVMQTGRVMYSESSQMNPDEAALAVYRYFSATYDRTTNDLEKDKLIRLYFNLYWNKNRVMSALQLLTMGPGEASEGVKRIENIEELLEDIGFPPTLNKKESNEFTGCYKNGVPILDYLANSQDLTIKLKTVLMEIKTELRSMSGVKLPVDNKKVVTLEKRLKQVNDEIEALEKELNLKVKHGEDSATDKLRQVQSKLQRFAAANSGLFEVRCESCGWHGAIERRRPPDSPVNTLHTRRIWQCPSCKTVMALDRKHPFFDGSVPWSHKAWELVEAGDKFTILGMAYILGVAPEGIMWVAKRVFSKAIPSHVQEDFDNYESTYLQAGNRDMSEKSEMPDAGTDEESKS